MNTPKGVVNIMKNGEKMKNRILQIINRLFLTFALSTTVAVGIAKANTTTNQNVSANRQQMVETLRSQIFDNQKSTNSRITKNVAKTGLAISEINKNNFDIGQRFAFTVFDLQGLEEDEKAYQFLVVDLVELIDKFEGQPEAVELQKVLTSVVRNTATVEELQTEVERIAKNYLSQQKKEQQWYFNSGSTITNLVIASYFGDDTELKNRLSEMQALITIAPKETPGEMLAPMGDLVKYIAKATLSEDDYVAIFEGAMGITESVIA